MVSAMTGQNSRMHLPHRPFAWFIALCVSLASIYFVLIPMATVAWTLRDPGWRDGSMPAALQDWHDHLSVRFAPWATARRHSGRAQMLDTYDISGTEWPLFGAVFYLWATEAMQANWAKDGRRGESPAQRAAPAIAAAAALLADPAQADWVRRHWGERYLTEKNLYYRMLLIAGLDSFETLTGDQRYHDLLSTQVNSLAAELDASVHGVLEEYPGESYSVDHLLACAALAKAHRRLGTFDPAWLERGKRAFQGAYLDARRQLPSYVIDADSGMALGNARGVGMTAMLIQADTLWPDLAHAWYEATTSHYWQSRWGIVGFREFAQDEQGASDWMTEVDAGPVVAGFGTAASAFGVGAARRQGDMDRAYPLAAQAVLAAWPLPNGTLLGPRLVSNLSDAPLVGEAALLYALSQTPAKPAAPSTAATPAAVWLVMTLAVAFGLLLPALCIRLARRRRS